MAALKLPELPLDGLQQKAVRAPRGPVLITGGAGTGKTHSLLGRAGWLLEQKEPPNSLAVITGTIHGASDLKERLAGYSITREKLGDIFVGSLDRYALEFLRTEGAAVQGISPLFTLRDRPTSEQAFTDLVEAAFDPKPTKGAIRNAIEWRRLVLSLDDVDPRPPSEPWWREATDLYVTVMRQEGVVDSDEVIGLAIRAMSDNPAARERWTTDRPNTMVDDLHEMSGAQWQLLGLVVGPDRSITVTVNPNEATAFRQGWDHRLLGSFRLRYGPERRTDVHLRVDHRSTGHIAEVAIRLADHQDFGGLDPEGKVAIRSPAARPRVWRFQGTPEHMYDHVLADIRRRHDEHEEDWGNFAILYRNPQTLDWLRTVIIGYGIPYTVLGDTISHRAGDAGSILAMLACALNPRDSMAFRRGGPLQFKPPRDIKPAVFRRVQEISREEGMDLVRAAERLLRSHTRDSTADRDLRHLTGTVKELEEMLRNPHTTPSEMSLAAAVSLKLARGEGRRKTDPGMIKLSADAMRLTPVGGSPKEALAHFLDLMHGDPDDDPLSQEQNRPFGAQRGVTFCSLKHSAGLEWPTVYLLDCDAQTFPRRNRPVDQGSYRAEQRLVYVATSRAQDSLTFCYAVRSGSTRQAEPSPFLGAVGDGVMEWGAIPIPDPWA